MLDHARVLLLAECPRQPEPVTLDDDVEVGAVEHAVAQDVAHDTAHQERPHAVRRRQTAEGGEGLSLSTVFFPLLRIEKLLLDDDNGSVPSLSKQFERRVGRTVCDFTRRD